MCGITGILSFNNASVSFSSIYSMTQTINHRGPDGEGFLIVNPTKTTLFHQPIQSQNSEGFGFLALGHKRLSILDLSDRGLQPMSYQSSWIVYNGEVYNYKELKVELEALGHQFITSTDTEVILAAYNQWGKACVERLNGMFAFAIYDSIKTKLFLARDRFGIKPLYYFYNGSYFLFASEAKALLQHPIVDRSPDLAQCQHIAQKGNCEWESDTPFKSIKRFPSASFLELDCKNANQLSFVNYWKPQVYSQRHQYNEAEFNHLTDEYFRLLNESLVIRLRSDVTVGSALSGGLDSSSLVYLVNQHLSGQQAHDLQKTFSNVYRNENLAHFDESKFMHELAHKLKLNAFFTEPNADLLPLIYPKLIWHMDFPPADSCMSGWHVYQLAAQNNVKVTIDGQGADEILAGYNRYFVNHLANSGLGGFAMEAIQLKHNSGKGQSFVIASLVLNLVKRIISQQKLENSLIKKQRNPDMILPLNDRLAFDTTHELVNLLHYSDRLSMAHSVESRLPFLDNHLVDFVLNVPACYKIHNGFTKYLARKAFSNHLPANIVWRKDKMGFPNGDAYWFKGQHKQWMEDEINGSRLLKELNVSNGRNSYSINDRVRQLNIALWERVFL